MHTRRARLLVASVTAFVLALAGCADVFPPQPPAGEDPAGTGDPSAPSSEDPDEEPPADPGGGVDEFEVRSLDGSDNNPNNPDWGAVGQPYGRVGAAVYADDGSPRDLPAEPRYISNRIYNDTHQNLFSARGVTQWTWLWGQFIDHNFGLRDGNGAEDDLVYDDGDAQEEFVNEQGTMPFQHSARIDDTEQANLVSSFIDGWAIYGGDEERLEWLRDGPVDGDLSNNAATMLTTDDGYLPSAASRPDATAPTMEVPGRLSGSPDGAVIAGDVRANENMALTGAQTLFVREHNRIVGELPDDLDEQRKFEIARRLVGAEIQYITYEHFLPAVGVDLPEYTGYDPSVDPSLTNEFATVGFRGHSMIHGEIEMEVEPGRYTDDQLDAFDDLGVEIEEIEEGVELAVPLAVAFGAPELVPAFGLGPLLAGMAAEAQYRNDEQFDNQLRSVLFMNPRDDIDISECMDGPSLSECYSEGVVDLAVADIKRALDHGIPSYNELRQTFGLEPKTSFTDITGEDTDQFPDDPEIDQDNPIDDPAILEFVELRDADGNVIPLDDEEAVEGEAVEGDRRTALAARLAAIYGDVDALDPFTGMVSEQHVDGTELGELQLAIWADQFAALRDGDRFFYANDPVLEEIEAEYGLTFRRTVNEILLDNTDLTGDDLPEDVFFAGEEE